MLAYDYANMVYVNTQQVVLGSGSDGPQEEAEAMWFVIASASLPKMSEIHQVVFEFDEIMNANKKKNKNNNQLPFLELRRS